MFVTKQIIESTPDTCTKAGTRFLNNYDIGKDNSLEGAGGGALFNAAVEKFSIGQKGMEKQNSTNRDYLMVVL